MRQHLIEATIAVWEGSFTKLKPTPKKFHYEFNIRELARVFGGIARVAQLYGYKVIQNHSNIKEKISSQLFVIGLWRHEAKRTFEDKLVNDEDKKAFKDILERVTKDKFQDNLGYEPEQLATNYYFADFQRGDVLNADGEVEEEAPKVYEGCADL